MYLCFQVKRLKNIFALNFHSVPKYNLMKQCIFTLLFVINACFSYAQSPGEVSGKITTNNKPLASATVSLFMQKILHSQSLQLPIAPVILKSPA